VIILLRDRVEFVIVAPRAMDGEAEESGHRRHHYVVAIVVTRDQAVRFALGKFNMPDEIPWARRDETGRDRRLRVVGPKNVAGKLFLYEPRVRNVIVRGLDDVITIRPGIGARFIFVVAMRFAEVNNIEPIAGPTFPVTF